MKYITGLLVVALLVPSLAFAQVKPVDISKDDSFVWDALIVLIVQLTNRITELEGRVAFQTPLGSACIPQVNEREVTLKNELSTYNEQLAQLRNEAAREKRAFELLGSGKTSSDISQYNLFLKENKYSQEVTRIEIERLRTELETI